MIDTTYAAKSIAIGLDKNIDASKGGCDA
jgi:hypothetical protein